MAFSYIYTKTARNDLFSIIEYISVDLSNSSAAKNLFQKVEKALELICVFPLSSPEYLGVHVHVEGLRVKAIDNYLLFYRVDETKEIIEIIRILFSKQDVVNII